MPGLSKMKNLIIVTGGAGFVGSNLISSLLKNTNKKNIMTRPAWNLIHQLDMYLDSPKSPLPVSESLSK